MFSRLANGQRAAGAFPIVTAWKTPGAAGSTLADQSRERRRRRRFFFFLDEVPKENTKFSSFAFIVTVQRAQINSRDCDSIDSLSSATHLVKFVGSNFVRL